ncbi:hypothetical protein COO91_09120 (plasmid) [Nostoc flagelliforme CCNUN1]|uniref:Uncharacterized protein n=1 Tax=Nostoc flagelliforme CCNUN1 TaxID=2038116 RepID=A0A2K8T5H9_9NOSO|nr:hypothetical protein COO91_09120 [Nostoc flagelliforme CCNUN1]
MPLFSLIECNCVADPTEPFCFDRQGEMAIATRQGKKV